VQDLSILQINVSAIVKFLTLVMRKKVSESTGNEPSLAGSDCEVILIDKVASSFEICGEFTWLEENMSTSQSEIFFAVGKDAPQRARIPGGFDSNRTTNRVATGIVSLITGPALYNCRRKVLVGHRRIGGNQEVCCVECNF
jgi:hypothetical protein